MSRKFIVALSAGLALAAFGVAPAFAAEEKPAAQASAASIDGPWHFEMQGRNNQPRPVNLKFKQDGEKLTGTVSGFRGQDTEISDGTIKGNEISFKVVRSFNGQEYTTKYTGKLEGDTLKLKSESTDRNGQPQSREFEAKRGEAPASQPAAQ